MPVTDEQIAQVMVGENVKLFSYLWSILRDDHMVDDALQQLSLLALRKRGEINDVDHLMGWLRTSGRYLALQMIERNGRRARSLSSEVAEQLEASWAKLDRRSDVDSLEALRHCMGLLSESARRVVKLKYVGNLSGDRLAGAAGQSRSACYRHLAQATQQLAECVQRELTGDTR